MNYDDAANLTERFEGYRNKIYLDSLGNITGGIGHHFSVGSHLPVSVVRALFYMDFSRAISDYHTICEAHQLRLDSVRRAVILDMVFNLGLTKALKFKKMLKCLQKKDYEGAAREMMDSRWSKQVKGRAVELAEMMRTGNHDMRRVR